jgi:hypothetical protein
VRAALIRRNQSFVVQAEPRNSVAAQFSEFTLCPQRSRYPVTAALCRACGSDCKRQRSPPPIICASTSRKATEVDNTISAFAAPDHRSLSINLFGGALSRHRVRGQDAHIA